MLHTPRGSAQVGGWGMTPGACAIERTPTGGGSMGEPAPSGKALHHRGRADRAVPGLQAEHAPVNKPVNRHVFERVGEHPLLPS